MTDAQIYQSRIYGSAEIAVFPQIFQARIYAMINIPAEFAEASQAYVMTAAKFAPMVEASQARVYALVRGRTANPRLRAWTFTLDGHDFYVLRLGDQETLIYDAYSEQWVEWTTGEISFWRANTGMNWLGAKALAGEFGSTIVVGDDTFGLLWFLAPEQPYDEHPDELRTPQQLPFERIATGQVLASTRQNLSCFVVVVNGDNYGLSGVDFTPTITLETSDDQGRNFDTHETLTVEADISVEDPYAWYSLGGITSPGRMFRITDNGLFSRIDSMEMNDAG